MERSAAAGQIPRPKPVSRKSLFKNKKVLAVGAIVALAVIYLVYSGIASTSMYYMTVDELLSGKIAASEEQLRISGAVVDGTVQSDSKNMTLRFTAAGETKNVPVVYRGVVPDSFKPGAEVVLEGRLTSAGIFEANNLLAKCPTKYTPVP
ncbi:MAG: cytochrome c maturation protein CcmE [Dehalococcoidia bacterium]|nr:cytochrome c maturation protein CcmE [Dehalococcoidia bacterium]